MQHHERNPLSELRPPVEGNPFLLTGLLPCACSQLEERARATCPACVATRATLRLLEMKGAYALTDAVIRLALTRRAAGNYALGYRVGGAFKVFYVGRSDSDLRRSLTEWVGMPSRYERYAGASKAACALRRSSTEHRLSQTSAFGDVVRGESHYTHFAFSYAPSAAAASAKESRNHDDFGRNGALDNETRPRRESE